jgi:hypothetical protein
MDNEELSHLMDSYNKCAELKYRPRNNWFEGDWNVTKKENTMAEKKLYQINISTVGVLTAAAGMTHTVFTVKYGHKLAVNSAGKWVMELKGTGEVITCDKDDVEEVMPYTVSVQFQTGKQIYSYFAEKGSVELNAFYVFDAPLGRAIAQVVKLDTKAPAASVEFKPLAKLNVTLS